jgi:class 3 adenylate cyclase
MVQTAQTAPEIPSGERARREVSSPTLLLLAVTGVLATFAVFGLGTWKNKLVGDEIQRTQAIWGGIAREVSEVGEAESDASTSEDSLPASERTLKRIFRENEELLSLERYDSEGRRLFRVTQDGRIDTKPDSANDPGLQNQVLNSLQSVRSEPVLRLRWVFPVESSVMVLETRMRSVAVLVGGALSLIGLGLLVSLVLLLSFRRRIDAGLQREAGGAENRSRSGGAWSRLQYRSWPLWLKVFALVLIANFLTAIVLFESISRWQHEDLAGRIRREAVLLARLSNPKLLDDFSNHFYDPSASTIFRKSVSRIISVNSDLQRIRVISKKTGAVLFTSDLIDNESGGAPLGAVERVQLPEHVVRNIESSGFSVIDEQASTSGSFRVIVGGAEIGLEGVAGPIASLIQNQSEREAQYWVEYRFGMRSLLTGIAGMRRDLVLNLLPVLALSIALALGLARFLSEPLRRLISALDRIARGDLSAQVEVTRTDEIGQLEDAFNTMTDELRRKQELKKYLSDATYRQVIEAGGGARSTGETGARKLEAAVLFSDIRGFVTHCETSEAEEVLQMLNEYFAEMVTAIYAHGGEVDKFIGDAVLAVFYIRDGDAGERLDGAACCLRALQAALEMKTRLRAFNERRLERRKFTIDIGIGISFGPVISGEMGTRERRDFTVIGDAVNVASRIEKASKRGRGSKIVFSGGVEERVSGLVSYDLLEEAPVAGKEERIRVCELLEIQEISTLIGLLKSQDPQVRVKAVELLALSRNSDSFDPLLGMLADGDETVRAAVARSLGHLPLEQLTERERSRGVDALGQRLEVEKSEKVLSSLVISFGYFCADLRGMRLAAFIRQDRSERLVANAVEALGPLAAKFPEVQDALIPLLSSPSNRVRANVARALFFAGRHEVLDSLTPMLLHSDPLMRASGVWALGELATALPQDASWMLDGLLKRNRGPGVEDLQTEQEKQQRERLARVKPLLAALQGTVPLLVGLLRDEDPRVRRQAISALGKIQDRSALLPILQSIDFTRDSREILVEVSQALRSIGAHRLVRDVVDRLT